MSRVLKRARLARQMAMLIAVAFVFVALFSQCLSADALAPSTSEYEKFVHTYVNSNEGNWTSVEKAMFPITFNETQIPIGGNWSIVEPLVANQSYHVYCYGEWVNYGANPTTNYDLYVYSPRGVQESEHTKAAGLAEQLGTNGNDLYFVPKTTGNYTFVVVNNAGSSTGTQAATFMTIENIKPNEWHTQYIEGRTVDSATKFSTSWAYEFVTDNQQVEVYIKIPDTLDMYESRLYAMSTPESQILNGTPLPWEPGLYGYTADTIGGYSLDSNQYRGVAYASCEYRGQDMTIKYVNPTAGKTLYQIVLIGESGAGTVDFLVKTQFGGEALVTSNQLGRIYPNNQTTITYSSTNTLLEKAVLSYTTTNWINTTELNMTITKMNCNAIIPAQKEGSVVQYRVTANDTLMNTLQADGNFTVKRASTLNIMSPNNVSRLGENVTIIGLLTGQNKSATVTIQFMNALTTETAEVQTLIDGSFSAIFPTNSTGAYAVQASFRGGDTAYSSDSNQLSITIIDQTFFAKNGIFLGGGFFGSVGIIGLVLLIRKRRQ